MIDIEALRIKTPVTNQSISVKHTGWCAIHDEGPCTCDADEIQAELELEEAGLTEEDFE